MAHLSLALSCNPSFMCCASSFMERRDGEFLRTELIGPPPVPKSCPTMLAGRCWSDYTPRHGCCFAWELIWKGTPVGKSERKSPRAFRKGQRNQCGPRGQERRYGHVQ